MPATNTFMTSADLDGVLGTDEKSRVLTGAPVGAYESAVENANSTCAAYLSGKELLEVPAILKKHASSIARFMLYRDKATERVTADNTDALAFLRLCAQGVINLPLVAPPAGAENLGLGVLFSTPVPGGFTGMAY